MTAFPIHFGFSGTPAQAAGSEAVRVPEPLFNTSSQFNPPLTLTNPSTAATEPDTFGKIFRQAAQASENRYPFDGFTHRVSARHVPDPIHYYLTGLKEHFLDSWETGARRNRENMKQHPRSQAVYLATGTALGLLFTALHTKQGWVKAAGLGLLGMIPLFRLAKSLAKLSDAYTEAKRGNPRHADAIFKSSMDDISMTIHPLLRPLALGSLLSVLLTFPIILRKNPPIKLAWFDKQYVRPTLMKWGLQAEKYPLKPINALTVQLERMGEWLLEQPERILKWVRRS